MSHSEEDEDNVVFSGEYQRTEDHNARNSNIQACRAVSNLVQPSFGPAGTSKMLVDSDGNYIISNNGATIFKSFQGSHPAANAFINRILQQEREFGDGVTRTAIIGGQLLERVSNMLEESDEIRPYHLIQEVRIAEEEAIEIIDDIGEHFEFDQSGDLHDLIRTTLTDDLDSRWGDILIELLESTVHEVNDWNFENVQITATTGSNVETSKVIPDEDGVIISLRAATQNDIIKLEQMANDGLSVLQSISEDSRVLPGGGANYVEIAKRLRDRVSDGTSGYRQRVVEEFADAIESIPRTLAVNAGMDPIDALVDLRAAHEDPDGGNVGIAYQEGELADMKELGVIVPIQLVIRSIENSVGSVEEIIQVDDIVQGLKPIGRAKTVEQTQESELTGNWESRIAGIEDDIDKIRDSFNKLPNQIMLDPAQESDNRPLVFYREQVFGPIYKTVIGTGIVLSAAMIIIAGLVGAFSLAAIGFITLIFLTHAFREGIGGDTK